MTSRRGCGRGRWRRRDPVCAPGPRRPPTGPWRTRATTAASSSRKARSSSRSVRSSTGAVGPARDPRVRTMRAPLRRASGLRGASRRTTRHGALRVVRAPGDEVPSITNPADSATRRRLGMLPTYAAHRIRGRLRSSKAHERQSAYRADSDAPSRWPRALHPEPDHRPLLCGTRPAGRPQPSSRPGARPRRRRSGCRTPSARHRRPRTTRRRLGCTATGTVVQRWISGSWQASKTASASVGPERAQQQVVRRVNSTGSIASSTAPACRRTAPGHQLITMTPDGHRGRCRCLVRAD